MSKCMPTSLFATMPFSFCDGYDINNNNNNNNDNNADNNNKYLDLARELKKLWKMKVAIIPIVIGVFGIVTKGLLN